MECPVCYDIPYEALIFPCGHTLCKFCYERILDECPICRIKGKPFANYFVRRLLDAPEHQQAIDRCRSKECQTDIQKIICKYPDWKEDWEPTNLFSTDFSRQLACIKIVDAYLCQGPIQCKELLKFYPTYQLLIFHHKPLTFFPISTKWYIAKVRQKCFLFIFL